MPTLMLQGHNEHYAATEMMRLFFGNPVQVQGSEITAGNGDLLLESSLEIQGTAARITTRVIRHLPGTAEASLNPEAARTALVKPDLAGREIKRQLYQVLSALTQRAYPWGSLVGIRPTLVAAEGLRQAADDLAARRLLTDTWFVSPEKADLAVATARAEQAVLDRLPAGSLLVYIGIPFCPTRCSYCSFITRDAPGHASLLEPYVNAVIAEAQGLFQEIRTPVQALYIGGGTPTSLSARQLERLLQGILPCLPLVPDAEMTVEAGRPDTIDKDKLAVLRGAGINRLCINPQTFHDVTLKRIGRCHTTEQTRAAYRLARETGFQHINLDLIAGLPGEQPADLADSLQQALRLEPDSLTLHALALKRSSALHEAAAAGAVRPRGGKAGQIAADGLSLQPAWDAMLQQARQLLAANGFMPYYLYRQKQAIGGLENTGFARQGKACVYNVGMMSDRCGVLGIGSGSMSKKVRNTRVDRLANPRDLAVYLDRAGFLAERKIAWFKA